MFSKPHINTSAGHMPFIDLFQVQFYFSQVFHEVIYQFLQSGVERNTQCTAIFIYLLQPSLLTCEYTAITGLLPSGFSVINGAFIVKLGQCIM